MYKRQELIKLFPEGVQPQFRHAYNALDITNNLFNLGYEVLKWEVYKSVINAHLDPYLGFLHSMQHGKPSLVCDLQEPYRPLIDGFLVNYCKHLEKKDFEAKYDGNKPRIFLKHKESSKMISSLNSFLNFRIKKQRARKFGTSSKIKTIIREDVEELGKYITKNIHGWVPQNLSLF